MAESDKQQPVEHDSKATVEDDSNVRQTRGLRQNYSILHNPPTTLLLTRIGRQETPAFLTAKGVCHYRARSNAKLPDTRVRPPKAATNLFPDPWRHIRLPDIASTCEGEDLVLIWAHLHHPTVLSKTKLLGLLNFELSYHEQDKELFENLKQCKYAAEVENLLKDRYSYTHRIQRAYKQADEYKQFNEHIQKLQEIAQQDQQQQVERQGTIVYPVQTNYTYQAPENYQGWMNQNTQMVQSYPVFTEQQWAELTPEQQWYYWYQYQQQQQAQFAEQYYQQQYYGGMQPQEQPPPVEEQQQQQQVQVEPMQDDEQLAAMTLHELTVEHREPRLTPKRGRKLTANKKKKQNDDHIKFDFYQVWKPERQGRPPSYDDQVKWCVTMKRLVFQKYQVYLTLAETIKMANKYFRGCSKLVASTLRKRVVATYGKATWSDIATFKDPHTDVAIVDQDMIAAMECWMPIASLRLKKIHEDALRGVIIPQLEQEPDEVEQDESEEQQQTESEPQQQQQQQTESEPQQQQQQHVEVENTEKVVDEATDDVQQHTAHNQDNNQAMYCPSPGLSVRAAQESLKQEMTFTDIQAMALAIDLENEIAMFNVVDSLTKVSLPGLSREDALDFISAWILEKVTPLQKKLLITNIQNNIVDDPFKVTKCIHSVLHR